nr:MAG TPA: hypothetical protein [Caudoviricetes sp.]
MIFFLLICFFTPLLIAFNLLLCYTVIDLITVIVLYHLIR